jgi:hypothetical protein
MAISHRRAGRPGGPARRHREEPRQLPTWNFAAMGQAGLTGRTRDVARPLARAIARRTGRSEADILSLMGTALLAMAVINFVRLVSTVIKAGRTGRQPRAFAGGRLTLIICI